MFKRKKKKPLPNRNPEIAYFFNARSALKKDNVVKCDDAVAGVEVISSGRPPSIDAKINDKPTLTFGFGVRTIRHQMLCPRRYGALDLGDGGWSICMLIKATGFRNEGVIIGPERAATMSTGHFSPYFRLNPTGGKRLGVVFLANDGTIRAVCNTHEFFNTDRLLMVCGTPGVGLKWYVDDWSRPAAKFTTDAAKAPFTDSTFTIGGSGALSPSHTFVGSLAVLSVHKFDLSLRPPARHDLMKAIAAYGGITSN